MNSLLPTVVGRCPYIAQRQSLLELAAAQARFGIPVGPMLPQRPGCSERSMWRLLWSVVLAATVVVPVLLHLI